MKLDRLMIILVVILLTISICTGCYIYLSDNETYQRSELPPVNKTDQMVTEVMKNFEWWGNYNYCSLNTKYLTEFYSANFEVKNFSKYGLILHAMALNIDKVPFNDDELPAVVLKITELNEALDKLFLNPAKFTEQDIKNNFENYGEGLYSMGLVSVRNIKNDTIEVFGNIYGCEGDDDRLFKEITKAEKDNEYLYVYEKVGFGFYDGAVNGINYYKDINKQALVEIVSYNEDEESGGFFPDPDVNGFNTYIYTFKLIDNVYKLVSVKLSSN